MKRRNNDHVKMEISMEAAIRKIAKLKHDKFPKRHYSERKPSCCFLCGFLLKCRAIRGKVPVCNGCWLKYYGGENRRKRETWMPV